MVRLLILLILTLGILALPLLVLPSTTDPVGFHKQLVLTVLALAGLGALSYQWLRQGSAGFFKSIVNIGVAGLILAGLLSTLYSQSLQTSLWGSSANFLSLFTLGLLGAFYLLLISVTSEDPNDEKKMVGWSLNISLLSILLVVIFSTLQLKGVFLLPWEFAKNSAFNTIGTLNSVGILAGLGLIIAFLRGVLETRLKSAFWFLISAFFFVYLLLIDFKSVWIALSIAVVVVMPFFFLKKEKLGKAKGKATAMFFALIIFLFLSLPLVDTTFGVFPLPIEVSPSRGLSFDIASKTLSEEPIFGSGLATFAYQYQKFRDPLINQTPFWSVRFGQGNSFFSTFMTETGVVGVAAVALVIVTVVVSIIKTLKREEARFGATFIFISGLIYLLTIFFFYPLSATLWFFVFLMLGLWVRLSSIIQHGQKAKRVLDFQEPPAKTFVASLAILVLVMGVLFASYLFSQHYLSSYYIAKAITTKDTNEAINNLNNASRFRPGNELVLRLWANASLVRLKEALNNRDPDLDDSQYNALLQNLINLAELNALRAYQRNPVDSINALQVAQVYSSLVPLVGVSSADQALEFYQKAKDLDPQNPAYAANVAQAALQAADARSRQIAILRQGEQVDQEKVSQLESKIQELVDKALEAASRAVELKSDYAPGHFLLVQIYNIKGELEQAAQQAEVLIRTVPSKQSAGLRFQLGFLRWRLDQLDKAREQFEQAVKISPNFSNARYFLGLIYSKQGSKEAAVEQFERILELNPDNKEVPKIIDNLKADREPLAGISPPVEQRTSPPIPEETPREEEQLIKEKSPSSATPRGEFFQQR